MSEVVVNGHRAHYRLEGSAASPVIVLSNSLGTTFTMWDEQMPALTQRFRVLRYDTRGHSGSEVTPGEYTIEQLGFDVLELTAALGIEEFSFCGISMGGLIGQWLAIVAGSRLRRVVLCNTAAKIGNADGWNARIVTVRRNGLAEVAQSAIGRWFTPAFAAAEPARVEVIKQQLLGCDPAGYAANCAAVRDADFRGRLAEIRIPALVIAGAGDTVTTVADAEALVRGIPGATHTVLDAAHLSNINDRQAFDAALSGFLAG